MKKKLLALLLLFACTIIYANNKSDSSSKTSSKKLKTTNAYMPVLSVTSVTVQEDDGIAVVPIQLDVVDTVATTINITTVDNTATNPDDYTLTTSTITIPAGQLSANIVIPITSDFLGEPTETFFVNAVVTSGNTANTTASGTVTIGQSNIPVFSVQDVTVQESAGTAQLTITLTNPSSEDTVLDITTQNNTAVSPVDYTAINETGVVLPAGQISTMYTIPIIDDNAVETNEDFTVFVSVSSGNTANSWESATVTITDNDDAFMSIDNVTIVENDGSASVPVTLSAGTPTETTIQITTVDNTATNPDDYTTTTITATIPPFQTLVNVEIPITDDLFGEPTEDFTVFGTVTSGNILNSNDSATVTIIDNDESVLIINDMTVAEDASSITVPITIDVPSVFDTQINITTMDNTAMNPNDYSSVTTTVTIPALQTMTSVSIPITDDDVFETQETFSVQGVVTTGNTVNVNTTATITIVDDGSCASGLIVGSPCDDGNPATLSDFIDENCNCIGETVADVDGDGILNGVEVLNGTDYNDPCDPVQTVGYTGFDQDNSVWQAGNCDNDDINNALEIILGSDPYDTNYNTIQGSILYDVNGDGCNGNDDVAFSTVPIMINDGTNTHTVFTDNMGSYTYIATSGNYTITPNLENPTFFVLNPMNASTSFASTNNSVFNQDFCATNSGTNPDVEITIAPIEFARPGFDAVYLINYRNKGNQIASGDITFNYDDNLTSFVSSTEMPTSQANGMLSWAYTNLVPFENRTIYVVLNINAPTAIPPVNNGDELTYTASITPTVGDIFPEDNQFEYEQTVVGSYDPNDITCLEGNVENPDRIGEYLHYVINFENTGTFFAENIVVEMDVDPTEFDINTLVMMSSSHTANVAVEGNTVRFIFQQIFLPVDGQGNILLKLKTQNNLVENDAVSNDARIFFDYNFPIQTNNAETVFAILNTPIVTVDTTVNMYPNPTQDNLYIEAIHPIQSIEIYDIQGRRLAEKKYDTTNVQLDMSEEANGVYFIKIKTDKGIKTEKIIKM